MASTSSLFSGFGAVAQLPPTMTTTPPDIPEKPSVAAPSADLPRTAAGPVPDPLLAPIVSGAGQKKNPSRAKRAASTKRKMRRGGFQYSDVMGRTVDIPDDLLYRYPGYGPAAQQQSQRPGGARTMMPTGMPPMMQQFPFAANPYSGMAGMGPASYLPTFASQAGASFMPGAAGAMPTATGAGRRRRYSRRR